MKGFLNLKELKSFVNNFLAISLGPQQDREKVIEFFNTACPGSMNNFRFLTKEEVPIASLPGKWEEEESRKGCDYTRRFYL